MAEPHTVTGSTPAPDTGRASFPVVGIGASAGGLAAFEAFFTAMRAGVDPGMAFVLVQHLAPDHKSLLSELIRRYTRMQVFEVEDGMVVQPNCIYTIPPGRDMAFLNGTLQLLEPTAGRSPRLPIDFFFRSLAAGQRERAIGIVLSGTGNDGAQGVRAIKGEGGMVMVQNTASSEFDGMPNAAIATGLVDYKLPPAEMPAQLIAYVAHAFGRRPRPSAEPASTAGNTMQKIFVLLRAQTGHDFSLYKPSAIQRRIERRMAVHQVGDIDDYVRYLQQTPTEVDALFRDLLIGVTSFFRDPSAFQVLQDQVIPALFAHKPAGAVVRVWVPGCSSGEEAYSIAILLIERMEALKASYTVQIFATDIDAQAITRARGGVYPTSIAAAMSPERLARFFLREAGAGGYRIHKTIRDMLVFSVHNVTRDPPFSRLDLISCRNLLIYMGSELQARLMPLFHYALKPGGWLFLGTAEGVGDSGELFTALDRKAKVYQRNSDPNASLPPPSERYLPPAIATDGPAPPVGSILATERSLRETTEQALLAHVIAAGVLVKASGDILYLHGRSGMFLEPSPGPTGTNNILKMARDGLRGPLTTALRRAGRGAASVSVPGLRVKTNGHFTSVNLGIRVVPSGPGATPEAPLFLVVLEDAPLSAAPLAPDAAGDTAGEGSARHVDARITALKAELLAQEDIARSNADELQRTTEELKSSNEEMQSVNEELKSTNEELETSKEELQSTNEELATVNSELQAMVADLSRANNDMNNLLAGTGIGTVFVDHQLRIMRFTPAASSILNLIRSDIGRPVAHIVSNLVGYSNLVADAQAVLQTLVPKAVEVNTQDGRSFALRFQPYRTLDNAIEGAVISFVDITEMVATREALRKANELQRLSVVVRDASDAITVQDLGGRMLAWNPGAVRMYGWSEEQALAMNVRERIPVALRESEMAKLAGLSQVGVLHPHHTQRQTRDGGVVNVSVIATALVNEDGQVYAVATTERLDVKDAL